MPGPVLESPKEPRTDRDVPLADLADWRMAVTAGGSQGQQQAEAAADPGYQEWAGKLQAARLICPQWPEEFGGQVMGAVRLAVLNEEFGERALGLPTEPRAAG
jgi:alkylation response protein AidB-like acyl-CoA dehydrogenase